MADFIDEEMSEQLNLKDFSNNINTNFNVKGTDENVFEAELVEVLELRNDDILNTFSIVFLMPAEFGFEQRLYQIEHDKLGQMELFLVPVRQTESGIRFEAIFNRVVKK